MPSAPTGPGSAKPAGTSPYFGRTIARCQVGERLGRGATSHVFRARYEPLAKDVALKILAKDAAGADELRARFLSEARAVAKLDHENIVKVLDVVEDQGFLCILMELVQGPTLQDKLDDEGVIAPRFAFRIAAQIARALEAAHEENVVHRDVKPANVILSGRPGDEAVKVVDFGLAAQQDMNRVGTPLFMSPEAAQGKRIDEKSDVYALGVCLYRMLTGELPFTGATVKEILAAHVSADLAPPSTRRPQLGKTYDELLKKLLVKSKGYRPTAAEAADLLEDVADDLEEREAGVRRVRRRRKKPAKRASKPNPALWAGLAVAGVVIVIVAMLASGGKPPVTPAGGPSGNPAPAAVDPAQKAYDDTDRWIAENPANPAESVRRWGQIEQRYPGTKWATLAGTNRMEAQAANEAKQAVEAEAAKKRREQQVAAADPNVKHARAAEMVRNFQFGDAGQAMEELDPPSGTDSREWDRKMNRVQYLAKHWADKMDAGLHGLRAPLKARELFPAAKEGETIVGANSGGAVLFDGNQKVTVSWGKASPEAFFKMRVVPDRVLDTNDFESNVILAALAAELNQLDAMRKFLEIARGFPDEDESHATLLRSLFGD
jgi:serine/threonine-protein kinase